MGPKSRTLFHFTKSLDYLKGILQYGFRPRFCLEDTRHFGLEYLDYIAYPMCCFCDIPISRISDHTSFYGEYGLGMTKDWGQRNNLEPLIYVTSTGAINTFVSAAFGVDHQGLAPDAEKLYEIIDKHFVRVMCLTKPLSGQMLIGGKVVEKDFYQENEWRFVPPHYEALFEGEFETQRDKKNAELEKSPVTFLPPDIKYIFVKLDSEIPQIFDFIQNNLGQWPLNEIKILTSRIISLQTVVHDL